MYNRCSSGFWDRVESTGFLGDIRERAVAIISVQRVLAVVGDEQIVVAIVVVIADATGLSPSRRMFKARAFGDVGERSVAVVLEEVTMRLLSPFGKPSSRQPFTRKISSQPSLS